MPEGRGVSNGHRHPAPPRHLGRTLPAVTLLPHERSRRERVLTLLSVLVGLVVGAGILQAAGPGDDASAAQAEAAYAEGFALQKSKQTEAAAAAYERALALNPDHVKALYEVGWSYWVLGRWAEVVRVWERVLVLDPAHADAPKYLPEAIQKRDLRARLEASAPAGVTPAETPRRDGPGVRFTFGGDTMMGSELSNAGLPPNDGAAIFSAVAPRMQAADIAFLNLEGVLADGGRSAKCGEDSKPGACYAFRTPVRYAKNLSDAGIDVVSFANNHVNDYGAEGRRTTLAALDALGIAAAGPLDRTVILEVRGLKVGILGFATSPHGGDLRDVDLAAAIVRDMAAQADLVVVSFHGGAEGTSAQRVPSGVETFMGENRGDLRRFTHAVIDAGADLVVGHGPHVLRAVEVYKERLIAYSLGNFATYGGINLSGRSGLTVLLEVDLHPDGRLAEGRLIAGRQMVPGGPLLDPSGEAIAVVRELTALDFPGSAAHVSAQGVITP